MVLILHYRQMPDTMHQHTYLAKRRKTFHPKRRKWNEFSIFLVDSRESENISERSASRVIGNSFVRTSLTILSSFFVLAFASLPCIAFDKEHSKLTGELSKYVHDGLIDYASWKEHPEILNSYLSELGKISESQYKSLSHNEKKALWINAYNAFTIKLVLDNYPIVGKSKYYPADSIRQIKGFWEDNQTEICGEKVSLEDIEHNNLRRDFHDPRTHFAVVCAAKGCASIRKEAFSGDKLESLLDQSARDFVADPDNVEFDFENKKVTVSKIFLWFPLDFAKSVGLGKRFPPPTDDEIVIRYILANSPQAVRDKFGDLENVKEYQVLYREYDWALNDSGK